MEKQVLTDDQLWELCLLEEKKKRIAEESKYYDRDKGVDWEFQKWMYERSLDLK